MSSDQELRERVLKLEIKMEEVQKKVDSLAGYSRQLYEYLNRQQRE